MIYLTLNNKIRKHRDIYARFFMDTPTKIIISLDAYELLKSKIDNFTVCDRPAELGGFSLYGMLVLKSEKLSQYDFIFK